MYLKMIINKNNQNIIMIYTNRIFKINIKKSELIENSL